MRLGVMIAAYREERFIEAAIRQYQGIADRIIVGIGKKPWKGNLPPDDTEKIARKTGAQVYVEDWEYEAKERNFLMDRMYNIDYVIVSHADTFFTRDDLIKLKEMYLTKLHYTCKVLTYWKDYDTVIDPDISIPALIVRSDAIFLNMNNIHNMEVEPEVLPITCYHLSWVKADDEIKSKIASYSHAGEIDYSWFDKKFKNWKEGDTDFAPTVATDYKSTRKDPLPIEIRKQL